LYIPAVDATLQRKAYGTRHNAQRQHTRAGSYAQSMNFVGAFLILNLGVHTAGDDDFIAAEEDAFW
jgi:hypothetical protein